MSPEDIATAAKGRVIRLNQVMRGWVNYFKHAVCRHTLDALVNFAWHRVIRRRRWVTLLGQAAQEAGLPADPEFRAAVTSFIAWEIGSPPDKPTPRWDWGPSGPPSIKVPEAQENADQQVTLPDPGQPVSFAAHIKPLFRKKDRDSMGFALDLWSYEDVMAAAGDILERIGNGSMPCDGAWPKERVDVFSRWTTTQMQP